MKKVYLKEEVCMGCHLCEVYCQLQHAASKDLVKAFKRDLPPPVSRVRLEENGAVSLSLRCQHCDDAPCLYACLTGALSRDPESGVVDVDEDRCIGCWTCILACPFGALKLDTEKATVAKCDLCPGEPIPACVVNCPNEALLFVDTLAEV